MQPLMLPPAMPAIPGANIPYAFYWVLQQPAPLAGMPYPSPRTPWHALAAAGFSHIVCLTEEAPRYDPAPLGITHAVELEDLVFGDPPRDPVQEEVRIRTAVATAVDHLYTGEGVIVHCYGGRGRAGTVIGGILCALGYAGKEVCAYLNRLHTARGRTGWPEAAWQAQIVERFRSDEAG